MLKFQITQEDLHYYPEWTAGQWVLYMPGVKVYYFRDTEEEINDLMASLHQDNEKLRTAR